MPIQPPILFSHRMAVMLRFLFLPFLISCTQGTDSVKNPLSSDALVLSVLAGQNFGGANSPSSPTLACPPANLPSGVHLANEVVSAPGRAVGDPPSRSFGDPSRAITGVCGGGQFTGGYHVYELEKTGEGASLVLRWSSAIVRNVVGVDFIVFENAFQVQGSGTNVFIEPTIVEVSLDGTSYCGFNPRFSPNPASVTATQIRDDWKGFAGLTPVLYNMTTNSIPADQLFLDATAQPGGSTIYMGRSGGDGFDLDSDGFGGGSGDCSTGVRDTIRSQGFRFIRLTSASAKGFPEPLGAFQGGPDIDGVIARSIESNSQ